MSTNAASSDTEESEFSLVRANKLDLLERLADDLAHEIKNPLHSLVINLEVLKRRITRAPGAQSDEALRYVGVIDGELARVHRRIELLLRLVRPGRRSDEAPLTEIVEDLFELLELEGTRRKVRVVYEPGAGAGRAVLGVDAGRQIVLNLALAVLDTVAPGGTVTLRATAHDGTAAFQVEGSAPASDGPPAAAPLDDDRITAARFLCERIGAALVAGTGDETRGRSIGITLPITPR